MMFLTFVLYSPSPASLTRCNCTNTLLFSGAEGARATAAAAVLHGLGVAPGREGALRKGRLRQRQGRFVVMLDGVRD